MLIPSPLCIEPSNIHVIENWLESEAAGAALLPLPPPHHRRFSSPRRCLITDGVSSSERLCYLPPLIRTPSLSALIRADQNGQCHTHRTLTQQIQTGVTSVTLLLITFNCTLLLNTLNRNSESRCVFSSMLLAPVSVYSISQTHCRCCSPAANS